MKKIKLLFTLLVATFFAVAQTVTFTPTVIPMSDPEIVNPGRGFYRWNGNELAPVGTRDIYQRFLWVDLETAQGVYDFSKIDAQIAKAKAAPYKGKFSFAVYCIAQYSGIVRGYPDYLHALMEKAWNSPSASVDVPDWNDPDFLDRVDALWVALGNKYKNEVAIDFIEIRIYGNWGEWHSSGLGTPVAQEGQTAALPITNSSRERIIDAHVNAFGGTKQLIMMSDGDYGMKYCMDKITNPAIKYPIGWRRDSWLYPLDTKWGNYHFRDISDPNKAGYAMHWNTATNPTSQRWKIAPVIIESMSENLCDYTLGPAEITDYHGTAIGNGNWASNKKWVGLTAAEQSYMMTSAKRSGYRYYPNSITVPSTLRPGQVHTFTSNWSNVGVGLIYKERDVKYQLYNSSNVMVWSGTSSLALKNLLPTYNYSTSTNTPVTITDNFTLPTSIAAGTYKLKLTVTDPEKYYDSLNLAITGREAAGTYPLGDVTVALALPVTFGDVQAKITHDKILINWSTIKEVNNDYFIIEASKDGKNFVAIDTVKTLAQNGNSNQVTLYSTVKNLGATIGQLGMVPNYVSFIVNLFALLWIARIIYKRKQNNAAFKVPLFIVVAAFVLLVVACNKSKDEAVTSNTDNVFIRITQVDIDGTRETGKIVKAIRE